MLVILTYMVLECELWSLSLTHILEQFLLPKKASLLTSTQSALLA